MHSKHFLLFQFIPISTTLLILMYLRSEYQCFHIFLQFFSLISIVTSCLYEFRVLSFFFFFTCGPVPKFFEVVLQYYNNNKERKADIKKQKLWLENFKSSHMIHTSTTVTWKVKGSNLSTTVESLA